MATANYINECKNRANHNRLGKLIVNGINTPITNSDNLQKLEINSGCYINGSIIGSVYIKKLNGEFIALDETLTDKTIEAQIGVKYANNSTEYIKMGKYIVEKPKTEITANMKQITAYSILSNKLENEYVCNINYEQGNKTLKDLYIDVCNQLGLTPTTTTFDNSNIPITANPFTNKETNKVVLQTIAKIACTWVEINDDTNKIELCWLSANNNPDYTFEKSDYAEVQGGDVTLGPINCVVIKNSQVDDDNYTMQDGAGDKQIVISEDYILYNQTLRAQAMTTIWAKLHNLTYTNVKLTTYYGKPFLKIGSKIRVKTDENTYINTYVLMHTFTYDGTFTSVIESPVLTDQEIKTKQTTIYDTIKDTQFTINKQEQTIQALITTVEETHKKIDDLQPTEEVIGVEEMYLPNSAGKDLIEYRLKGKSEQKTYDGKNLYVNNFTSQTINGVTITKNSDGSITLNGTHNSSSKTDVYSLGSANQYPEFIIEDGHYILSNTGTNDVLLLAVLRNSNNTNTVISAGTSFGQADVTNIVGARLFIRMAEGVTYNNLTIYPQLEKNTKETAYEPYVGAKKSPNPDYPQDVKSIGDVRNLFDTDLMVEFTPTTATWYSLDGVSAFYNATNIAKSNLYYEGKANTTYTFSIHSIKNKNTTVANPIQLVNSNATLIANISQNNNLVTFTLTKDMRLYPRISVGSANIETQCIVQLEENTQKTDYIPHGNYIDVVNKGNQLVDFNSFSSVNISRYSFTNDILIVNCESGQSYPNINKDILDLLNNNVGRQLNFGFKNYTKSNADAYGIVQVSYKVNNGTQKYFQLYTGTRFNSFTIPENITSARLAIFPDNRASSLVNTLTIEEPLLYFDDSNKYQPYIEPRHNYINLTQPLPSLPNGTADELIVKDGKAKIIQNIGRKIFDGSENWVKGNAYTNTTDFRINSSIGARATGDNNIEAFCSHFVGNKNGASIDSECFWFNQNGYIRLKINNSTASTVDQFKNFLSNNNVFLQYALAEPVEIDLGEVSVKTIDGNDYLYITDPIKADMYAKYIRNTDYNDAYYTKHETDTQIDIAKDSITSSVSETYETKLDASTSVNNAKNEAISKANSYSDDILNTARAEATLYTNQKVTEEITATSERITVVENTIRDGVSTVRTETGYTFDADGLKIAKEGQEMNSLLDNDGLSVKRNTDEVLTVRSEGVNAENITVRNFFRIDPVRFEKISSTTNSTQIGLGIFYTGGEN